MQIPADMNDEKAAAEVGAEAVVSIRDLMILLGATDEQLRGIDAGEKPKTFKKRVYRPRPDKPQI